MRKRLLAYLLALCMVLGMLPMTAFAEEPVTPDTTGNTTGDQSNSSPETGDGQSDGAPSTEISHVAIIFNEENANLEVGKPFPTARTDTPGVAVSLMWAQQTGEPGNFTQTLISSNTVPNAGVYNCRFQLHLQSDYTLKDDATYTVNGNSDITGTFVTLQNNTTMFNNLTFSGIISSGLIHMNALAQTPPAQSSDATLQSLYVQDSEGHNYFQTSTFSPDVTNYTVEVLRTVESVTVTAVPNGQISKMDWTGIDEGSKNGTVTLTDAPKTVSVTVTAEDGKTQKTYSITLKKEALRTLDRTHIVTSGDLILTPYTGQPQTPTIRIDNIADDDVTVKLKDGDSEVAAVTNAGTYDIHIVIPENNGIYRNNTMTWPGGFVIQQLPASATSLELGFNDDNHDNTISAGDTVTARLIGKNHNDPIWQFTWSGKGSSKFVSGTSVYTVAEGDATVTVTAKLDPSAPINQNYTQDCQDLKSSFTVGTTPVMLTAVLKDPATKITKPYDGKDSLPDGTNLNDIFDLKYDPGTGETVLEGAHIVSGRFQTPSVGKKVLYLTVALGANDTTHTLTNTEIITDQVGEIIKAKPSLTGKAVTVAVGSDVHVEGFYDDSKPLTVESSDNSVVSVYWGPYNNKPSITFAGIKAGTATVKISALATDNFEALAEVTFNVTVTAKSTGGGGGGSSGGGGGGGGGGSSSGGGSSGGSTNTPTTSGGTTSVGVTPSVSNGSATANVSTSAAQTMVSDAAKNNSDNVTVKVNVPSGSTADSVTANVPASAVASLAKDTNASLTVDSPVADVTIPNSALSALGGTSGNVTVTAAKNGTDSVTVTVQKGGQTVGALSGGMKVNVPVSATAAQAGSGLVAVLVDANGAQTVLPKSTLSGGEMKVLLDSGSATLKFVDNSKSFVDSDTHWASSAVDFVSSRNLFQGTSPTEFSPETPMNRAMLVTVLHRLESEPSASLYSFNDVPTDSYYAEATAWAVGMGITNGMDGAFNGDGTITREMLATMLYRYVQGTNGGKGASGSYASMSDAGQVQDWADTAMRWAVGSGIITGDNGSLRPGDPASRAEVATMLQRFVTVITK